jgi:hypothetical protein
MLQVQVLLLASTTFVPVKLPVVPQIKQFPLVSKMALAAVLQDRQAADVAVTVQIETPLQLQPPLPSPVPAEFAS